MFKDFGRKMQRDVKRVVDQRLRLSEELSGGMLKVCSSEARKTYVFIFCVVAAETDRRERGHSPDATLCRLVRRKHARVHCELPQSNCSH